LLTQQLTLQVDDGQARRYPFTFCNAAGCVSRVGFTSEEIALFKRGNAATIRMVPAAAPDQEVILSVSLTGFTAAYDNLDEIGE
jgi:invasion protein IalB